MKRIIKKMSGIDKTLRETLLESYPNGLRTAPLVSVPFQGKIVKAYELKTEDAIYLIINDKRIDEEESDDRAEEEKDDDDFDDDETSDDEWDGEN